MSTVIARIGNYITYAEDLDRCYDLSKRACKRAPGCSYDEYFESCSPIENDSENKAIDDYCSSLSKRKCKSTRGCIYDKYEGCMPYPISDVDDDDDSEEDYNDNEDYCSDLSKRTCKRTPGCEYDKYEGCISSELDVDENEGNIIGHESVELRELTPPVPEMDPPEGWKKMRRRRGNRSSGMHVSCACLLPLPWWASSEGGFFCFCT